MRGRGGDGRGVLSETTAFMDTTKRRSGNCQEVSLSADGDLLFGFVEVISDTRGHNLIND